MSGACTRVSLSLGGLAVFSRNRGHSAFWAYRVVVLAEPPIEDLRRINIRVTKFFNNSFVGPALGAAKYKLEVS